MNSTAPLLVILYPRETECAVCETTVVDGNRGIAMFEGEPVPHDWKGEWGGFPCCEQCFGEFERVQGDEAARRVWFAAKRREVRNRSRLTPGYAGDL